MKTHCFSRGTWMTCGLGGPNESRCPHMSFVCCWRRKVCCRLLGKVDVLKVLDNMFKSTRMSRYPPDMKVIEERAPVSDLRPLSELAFWCVVDQNETNVGRMCTLFPLRQSAQNGGGVKYICVLLGFITVMKQASCAMLFCVHR